MNESWWFLIGIASFIIIAFTLLKYGLFTQSKRKKKL